MILRITYRDGAVGEWPVQSGVQISGDVTGVELIPGSFPKSGLTLRQKQVYDFIVSEVDRKGIPPSMRELGEHIGTSSHTGVVGHLVALEKKGFIKRHKGSRVIELLKG